MTIADRLPYSEDSVGELIRSRIKEDESCVPRPGSGRPFFVLDLRIVDSIYDLWKSELPGVRPFYAVKCNSDQQLLRSLNSSGAGFDCASEPEVRKLQALGVAPTDIILSNPCKSPDLLTFASQAGVRRTVFDSVDELISIKDYNPDAELLLRIFAKDQTALVGLSDKYGARKAEVPRLLDIARELELKIVGVCFHIGSGATNPSSFYEAIAAARDAFGHGLRRGHIMHVLDIGGGYRLPTFPELARGIRKGLSDFEFDKVGIEVIAEPGTLLAETAFTLTCKVISKRVSLCNAEAQESVQMLYQNDGVFGSFMNVLVERPRYQPRLIPISRRRLSVNVAPSDSNERPKYTIWGPTCDSTDCLGSGYEFEQEVEVGDWLRYDNLGAYSSACATAFNGFPSNLDVLYVE